MFNRDTAVWLGVVAAWLALVPLVVKAVLSAKWWRSRRQVEPTVEVITPEAPPPVGADQGHRVGPDG